MGKFIHPAVREIADTLTYLIPVFQWPLMTREHRSTLVNTLTGAIVDVRYLVTNDDSGGKYETTISLSLNIAVPTFNLKRLPGLPSFGMRIMWGSVRHDSPGEWVYKDGNLTLRWELKITAESELLGIPNSVLFILPPEVIEE